MSSDKEERKKERTKGGKERRVGKCEYLFWASRVPVGKFHFLYANAYIFS